MNYSTPLRTVDAKITPQSCHWDEILAEPFPDGEPPYSIGVWHYARGMAFAARGQCKKAQQELETLRAIATSPTLKKLSIWEINATINLLAVAAEILASKLASQTGNDVLAKRHLKRAVRLISGDCSDFNSKLPA
jgi:hypothetical protein